MSEAELYPVFLGLEDPFCHPDKCRTVVLPVPLERTTTYGQGTARGPAAILDASQQLELYDEELESRPYQEGIRTLPPLTDEDQSMTGFLEGLTSEVLHHLGLGKFMLGLGGEHTLTQAAVRAAASLHRPLGVVQFDAHADLRDTYAGDPFSHACVLRRIHEMEIPHLGVGIRSLSVGEAEFIEARGISMIWGHELADLSLARFRRALEGLPEKVYLTFDVDFLDPSLVPATGTPEPGGGFWWPASPTSASPTTMRVGHDGGLHPARTLPPLTFKTSPVM